MPIESVARTIFSPIVVDGTLIVTASNEPEASVFLVEGVVVITFPANVMVRSDVGAKPSPVTVIVASDGPIVGCMVMRGATVKLAVAEYLPSVAITACTPVVEDGTMNPTPVGIAPEDVAVVVAIVVPAYLIVITELGR